MSELKEGQHYSEKEQNDELDEVVEDEEVEEV